MQLGRVKRAEIMGKSSLYQKKIETITLFRQILSKSSLMWRYVKNFLSHNVWYWFYYFISLILKEQKWESFVTMAIFCNGIHNFHNGIGSCAVIRKTANSVDDFPVSNDKRWLIIVQRKMVENYLNR